MSNEIVNEIYEPKNVNFILKTGRKIPVESSGEFVLQLEDNIFGYGKLEILGHQVNIVETITENETYDSADKSAILEVNGQLIRVHYFFSSWDDPSFTGAYPVQRKVEVVSYERITYERD